MFLEELRRARVREIGGGLVVMLAAGPYVVEFEARVPGGTARERLELTLEP